MQEVENGVRGMRRELRSGELGIIYSWVESAMRLTKAVQSGLGDGAHLVDVDAHGAQDAHVARGGRLPWRVPPRIRQQRSAGALRTLALASQASAESAPSVAPAVLFHQPLGY